MNTNSTYRPEQVTLRIKHLNFLRALQAHGIPPEQMPVTRPLCGELIVSYAFDTPEHFISATPPLIAEAGLTEADLEPLALNNLRGHLSAQLYQLQRQPGAMRVETGEHLEAVTLLFDRFWSEHVMSVVEGEFRVFVPHRDCVYIADLAYPEAYDIVRQAAQRAHGDPPDTHALTMTPLLWTETGWISANTETEGEA